MGTSIRVGLLFGVGLLFAWVLLFVWVLLFRKLITKELMGTYIHKVHVLVIDGYLYSEFR